MIVSAALRLLWGFRVEVATLVTLALAWLSSVRATDVLVGSISVGTPLVGLLIWPAGRRFAWRRLRFASVRRRFLAAVRSSSFDRKGAGLVPTVVRVKETPAGYRLKVRVPAGTSVRDLENAAEMTAAAMRVADII